MKKIYCPVIALLLCCSSLGASIQHIETDRRYSVLTEHPSDCFTNHLQTMEWTVPIYSTLSTLVKHPSVLYPGELLNISPIDLLAQSTEQELLDGFMKGFFHASEGEALVPLRSIFFDNKMVDEETNRTHNIAYTALLKEGYTLFWSPNIVPASVFNGYHGVGDTIKIPANDLVKPKIAGIIQELIPGVGESDKTKFVEIIASKTYPFVTEESVAEVYVECLRNKVEISMCDVQSVMHSVGKFLCTRKYDITIPTLLLAKTLHKICGLRIPAVFRIAQIGPAFRNEQKTSASSLRQFIQINFERITQGIHSIDQDALGRAESSFAKDIRTAYMILRAVLGEQLVNTIQIRLNSRSTSTAMLQIMGRQQPKCELLKLQRFLDAIDKAGDTDKITLIHTMATKEEYSPAEIAKILPILVQRRTIKEWRTLFSAGTPFGNQIALGVVDCAERIVRQLPQPAADRTILDKLMFRGADYYVGPIAEICCPTLKIMKSALAGGGVYQTSKTAYGTGMAIGGERLSLTMRELSVQAQLVPTPPAVQAMANFFNTMVPARLVSKIQRKVLAVLPIHNTRTMPIFHINRDHSYSTMAHCSHGEYTILPIFYQNCVTYPPEIVELLFHQTVSFD